MKNIVGQTPRGTDFFKRDHIINKIYRRLDAGNHLFLSAPRRAGKTSIMRYLEDSPKGGYAFIYINTEDIKNSEDFFKLVSEELLNSSAVKKMTKVTENSKNFFKQYIDYISEIKVWALELKFNKLKHSKYKNEFKALMRKLDTDKNKIIIMLDEFPVTIENIKNEIGKTEAVNFLHSNRGIRQQANKGIQFIYTGSIGLSTIAGRLNATSTLNDLNIIEILPLSNEEAINFAQLILKEYEVQYSKEVLPYMLEKLQWLTPFFIQLIIQVLIDEFDETGKPLTKESVNAAFSKSSTHRSDIYFENYLTRLDKTLPPKEAESAKYILLEIAKNNKMSKNSFDELEGAKSVLEMLELDGYINLSQNTYRFNSPILKDWWKKHAN